MDTNQDWASPLPGERAAAQAREAQRRLLLLQFNVMTEDELALLCGVEPQTVKMWRHKGRGPKFTTAMKTVLYRRADVEAWLDERVTIPGNDTGEMPPDPDHGEQPRVEPMLGENGEVV